LTRPPLAVFSVPPAMDHSGESIGGERGVPRRSTWINFPDAPVARSRA
jgi:hypothetical protein